LLQRRATGDFDPREFDEVDMIVVGDPDCCIEKVRRFADIGVDQLICYVQFNNLAQASMENLRLLGREVIPVLERETAGAR
jgi:alkanesulfonate monooxygenase SsuD/methylene tetrahydromethanopterin reductase-like flavin-dependent oxidoreductase (luciferase family)